MAAFRVASAGDVNGDGYDDVIVSATGYWNGESNEGEAFLYLGSAGGLRRQSAWPATVTDAEPAEAWFGAAWRRPATSTAMATTT